MYKIINLFGNKPERIDTFNIPINTDLSLKYTARIEIFTLKQFLFYSLSCLSNFCELI